MVKNQHVAELDGIRGIAILLVMMTHYLGFEPWSLFDNLAFKVGGIGWMGVDVFFVLSGFLITGILYDTRHSDGYLRTFFARRALRIFPLYFAFVIGLMITAYLVIPDSPDAQRWRGVQGWYWTYTVNFLIAQAGSWGAAPLNSGHLWSLAIEEQFYLLWPFVVWKLERRTLMRICVVVVAGVLLLRTGLFLNGVSPISLFVTTPTRIDALLTGAFVALLLRAPGDLAVWRRPATMAMGAGAAILAAAVVAQRGTHQYGLVMITIGYTGIAIGAAGLVMAARVAEPTAAVRRALRQSWLRFFGTYSYALYMLHGLTLALVSSLMPAIESLPALAGIKLHWVLLRAGLSGLLAVAASLASWHLIEKRFLALKPGYGGDKVPSSRQVDVGAVGTSR